jgi:predicted RecA/RadA family phage recombinase
VATNSKVTTAPRWPVAACTSAHNAGDLVYEAGKLGVAVETNAAGGPNTLLTHGVFKLVVPGSLSAGQKVYAGTTSFTAGQTVQAVGTLTAPVASTTAPDNHRSAAVTAVLNTTNTNALVGTMMTASTTEGASVVADVELAPQ